jgi:hypothetical protein
VFLLLPRGISFSQAADSLRAVFLVKLGELAIPLPGDRLLPVFSPEAAGMLLDILTPLIPSLLPIALLLMGTAVTGGVRLILASLGAQGDFLPNGWQIRAGKASAAIYCGAQLVLLLAITTPDAQTMYYAANNISLLFMTPLALTGFGSLPRLIRSLRDGGAAAKAAVAVLIVMLLLAGLYWLCTAAAFYGVYQTFAERTDKRKSS